MLLKLYLPFFIALSLPLIFEICRIFLGILLDGGSSIISEKKSENKSIRLLQDCLHMDYGLSKKISYIIDLYENNPKIFKPLVFKYEETFRIIHSVIVEAHDKDLLEEASIQLEIKELLSYPMKDFAVMEKLLKENKDLEKNAEIAALNLSVKNEIDMLKEIKKLHGTL